MEHHLQGTNLLTEFKRMGEEYVKFKRRGEEERWYTGASGHKGEQRGGVRGSRRREGRCRIPATTSVHRHRR